MRLLLQAAKEADRDDVTSLHYAALAEHGCARARGFASDWVAALKHLEAAAKLWDRCGTYGTKTVHDWMDCSELMHALGSKKEAQQALKQAMSNVHGRYGVDVEQLATLQAQFLEV